MFRNDSHKCLKVEQFSTSDQYAFTINPIKQHFSSFDRHHKVCSDMKKFFSTHDSCSARMYLEISKLGRLHFHGYLIIKDILSFFLYFIPALKDISTFEIDTIQDASVWSTYCNKQLLWESYSQYRPLLLKYIPKYIHPPISNFFLLDQKPNDAVS